MNCDIAKKKEERGEQFRSDVTLNHVHEPHQSCMVGRREEKTQVKNIKFSAS